MENKKFSEDEGYNEFIKEIEDFLNRADSIMVALKSGKTDIGSINIEKPQIQFEQSVEPKLKTDNEYIEYSKPNKHKTKKLI